MKIVLSISVLSLLIKDSDAFIGWNPFAAASTQYHVFKNDIQKDLHCHTDNYRSIAYSRMHVLLQSAPYKDDDEKWNMAREKVRMVTKQMELEQLKYQDEDDPYVNLEYDDNDEYDEYNPEDEYDDDRDIYFKKYEDDMYEDLKPDNDASGNFWSNPQQSLDSPRQLLSSSGRRQRSNNITRTDPRNSNNNSGRLQSRPLRKTFRSGNPPPPNVIKDFYDALFWYGFDPDETTTAADRTMFGGTKGKFNGLNLLQDIEQSDGRRRSDKGMGRSNQDRFLDRFLDDDEDSDYDQDYENNKNDVGSDDEMYSRLRKKPLHRRRKILPPSQGRYRTEYPIRQRRRDTKYSEFDGMRKKVNQWFDDDNDGDDDDYDDEIDAGNENQSSSPIINLLDKVFQVDPQEVQNQAIDYNRRLGLDKARSSTRSGGTSLPSNRKDRKSLYSQKKIRKGYSYRMDNDKDNNDDDDLYDVVDVNAYDEVLKVSNKTSAEASLDVVNVIDVEAKISKPDLNPKSEKGATDEGSRLSRMNSKRKQQTWEDRAAASERVPPRGILSWGPEGAIDIEARTYAAQRAIKEIETAKDLYSKKEDAVNAAKETLIELKRDLSILKKELLDEDDRYRTSMIREEIRIMNFEIEECSRRLRRAKSEALAAIDKLESIELRHWTLLRQYEADQELQKTRES